MLSAYNLLINLPTTLFFYIFPHNIAVNSCDTKASHSQATCLFYNSSGASDHSQATCLFYNSSGASDKGNTRAQHYWPIVMRKHFHVIKSSLIICASKQPTATRAVSVSCSSKFRLCLANHRAGYFNNMACDWLSIVWTYSEEEIENMPW